jgi:hypothetical protein
MVDGISEIIPVRGNIATIFYQTKSTVDNFNKTVASMKRERPLNKHRPYNFTGWIYHYYYEHDCKADVLQLDAVPINQCLQDVTKSIGSYVYLCTDGR